MAYRAQVGDGIDPWWITGTGSVVNRLSEIMDDCPDGPAKYHWSSGWTSGTGNEWYVATPTKPDNVADNISGWNNLTDAGDDQDGSLAVDEWSYDTGNARVYVRLSTDESANSYSMRKSYAWDGSGAGPAFMTEVVEDVVYLIHLAFTVGDWSTSTTLTSENECVVFDVGEELIVKSAATLTLGRLDGDWGVDGSRWHLSGPNNSAYYFCNGGTINIYASMIYCDAQATPYFYSGVVNIKNSILNHSFSVDSNYRRRFEWHPSMTTINIEDLFYCNTNSMFWQTVPDIISDVRVHSSGSGVEVQAAGIEITGLLTTEVDRDIMTWSNGSAAYDITALDPLASIGVTKNTGHADSFCRESYTCNINVTDSAGAALENVVVDCVDADGPTAVWGAGTILTDASGDIAEQTIQYKRWTGESEVLTDYSPHIFTISLAGYETKIIEAVTVDHPLVWRVELKGPHAIGVGANVYHQDDS